jgi:uncharacterized phage protein (TIGR01671 family)
MREIKFRAWDGTEMIPKYCWLEENNHFYGEDLINNGYSSIKSVMQYTGLKDKNGKEIYEGDIVKFISHQEFVKGIIEYHAAGYCIDFRQFKIPIIDGAACNELNNYFDLDNTPYSVIQLEVIGNIHENPELYQSDKRENK